jgi:hypothetical protein
LHEQIAVKGILILTSGGCWHKIMNVVRYLYRKTDKDNVGSE